VPEIVWMKQIAPRPDLKSRQVNPWTYVLAGEGVVFKVANHIFPYAFHLTDNDGISILKGLVREHGSMNTPQNHLYISLSIFLGYFIGPVDIARKGGNPHQVCFLKMKKVEIFVQDPYVPRGRGDSSHIGET
jgi:hypothetical protein